MARIQTPVRPIQVDYQCEKCDDGRMRPTGQTLMSDPPQFPHKCTNCENTITFNEKYPTVRYALEGELIDFDNYKQQTL
jgi:hypothetical protein